MIFIFKEKQMKRKVAAYCRVSTKKEIQLYSLEAQKQYYKNLIESNKDFIFVGIYADTASGLKKKDIAYREYQRS